MRKGVQSINRNVRKLLHDQHLSDCDPPGETKVGVADRSFRRRVWLQYAEAQQPAHRESYVFKGGEVHPARQPTVLHVALAYFGTIALLGERTTGYVSGDVVSWRRIGRACVISAPRGLRSG